MADPLFKQGGYAPLVLPAVADWPTATPADVGLDARRVDEAIAYHRAHETRWRPDFITERGVFVGVARSEEHTSELQSHSDLVCRLLLEKKKKKTKPRRRGTR